MTAEELEEIKQTVKKTFASAASEASYYGNNAEAKAAASLAVAKLAQTLLAIDDKEQANKQKPAPATSTGKRLTT